MAEELPQELQDYISTILGLKDPYKLANDESSKEEQPNNSNNNKDTVLHLLFQADSFWNLGQVTKAKDLLTTQIYTHRDYQESRHGSLAQGLDCLCKGSLPAALEAFQLAAASTDAKYNSLNDDLLKVFFTERAVNIAFWLACSGQMLVQAAKLLEDYVENTPFAGGVLSFAVHMNGDSVAAETIARTAIQKGFDDPWTIHAVAHALASQDRFEECASWLLSNKDKSQHCNAFMKGHMEFHLALCHLALKDAESLNQLIHGTLWGTMSTEMKADYWNAVGLLNILWKAELGGVIRSSRKVYSEYIDQALQGVTAALSGVDASKSFVFSLCIFRFACGSLRDEWKKALIVIPQQEKDETTHVLSVVSTAISVLYHNNEEQDPSYETGRSLVAPIANKLDKLGASPEQREVIQEFVDRILC
jgi:hypothetical protein